MDEDGYLIIWGIINKNTICHTKNVNNWDCINLIVNRTINMQLIDPDISNMECTDILIDKIDGNHIYVATKHGYVIHSLMNNNAVAYPKKYLPSTYTLNNNLFIGRSVM